jgi:hypothetical protein
VSGPKPSGYGSFHACSVWQQKDWSPDKNGEISSKRKFDGKKRKALPMSKRNKHGNYLGGSSIEGSRPAFYARMAHRKRMTERRVREAKQERERFAAEREAFESRPKWRLIPRTQV